MLEHLLQLRKYPPPIWVCIISGESVLWSQFAVLIHQVLHRPVMIIKYDLTQFSKIILATYDSELWNMAVLDR